MALTYLSQSLFKPTPGCLRAHVVRRPVPRPQRKALQVPRQHVGWCRPAKLFDAHREAHRQLHVPHGQPGQLLGDGGVKGVAGGGVQPRVEQPQGGVEQVLATCRKLPVGWPPAVVDAAESVTQGSGGDALVTLGIRQHDVSIVQQLLGSLTPLLLQLFVLTFKRLGLRPWLWGRLLRFVQVPYEHVWTHRLAAGATLYSASPAIVTG